MFSDLSLQFKYMIFHIFTCIQVVNIRNKQIEDVKVHVDMCTICTDGMAYYLYAAQCKGVFPIISWQLILGG